MLLVGQRSFFELSVLDYEHDLADSSIRSKAQNLLWVGVRSGWQQHQSTSTAAILYVHELKMLHDWLNALQLTGRSATRLCFKKPCLGFECLSADSSEFLLQVKLANEIAPDWHKTPLSPFWLPIVISRHELARATGQLATQVQKFAILE